METVKALVCSCGRGHNHQNAASGDSVQTGPFSATSILLPSSSTASPLPLESTSLTHRSNLFWKVNLDSTPHSPATHEDDRDDDAEGHDHLSHRVPKHRLSIPSLYVKKVIPLGIVRSTTAFVKRDLGFQGQFQNWVLLTYGDTMFSDPDYTDEWRGMTCNSLSFASHDPTFVYDPLDTSTVSADDALTLLPACPQAYPKCFLEPNREWAEDPSTHSLGITNIVQTASDEGIVFFLLNDRSTGLNNLLGAGVALVTTSSSSRSEPCHRDETHSETDPTTSGQGWRRGEGEDQVSQETQQSTSPPTFQAIRSWKFWWNAAYEPWFGDVCALGFRGFVYAYGHKKDNPWVYLARVPTNKCFRLDAYEYWNGKGWQKERLGFSNKEVDEEESVFWQVNQGQVFWSRHHRCLMFVYCDNFWSCQILARTAYSPEGPWSDPPITLFKPTPQVEGGNVYAAIPHPYYDPSGQTLVVSYTNHPNQIEAVKVVFESRYSSPSSSDG